MVIICRQCMVAILEQHPELHWWRKCPVCAYCEFNIEWVPPSQREQAANNPYVKRYFLHEDYLYKKS